MRLDKIHFNPILGIFSIFFVVGMLIYSNTLDSPFFYDDHHVIGSSTFEQAMDKCKSPRRFVAHLSFALNLYCGGREVRSYHVVNTVIHICTAFGVFLVLFQLLTVYCPKRLEKNNNNLLVISALCGAVFLTHPLATQSVTYICQRYNCLATLFYVMALACFISARRTYEKHRDFLKRSHALRYVLSLLFAIAAMFTKEFPITFPAIVILTEFLFLKGGFSRYAARIAYLAPFVLTGLIIPLLYLPDVYSPDQAVSSTEKVLKMDKLLPHWGPQEISRESYLFTQIEIICFTYLKLLVLPWGQSFDHDYVLRETLFTQEVLTSLLILIALLVFAVLAVRRLRFLSYGIFWFFITISPTSSIVPNKQIVVEHRVYLPMISLCALLVEISQYLKNTKTRILCFTPILLLLSVLTVNRNRVWKDGFSVWSDAAMKSPQRDRPHLALGDIYFRRQDYKEAAIEYQKFLDLNQGYSEGFVRLGLTYMKLKNFDMAIDEFKKAAFVNSNNLSIYRALTSAYLEKDSTEMAIKTAKKLISLNPSADSYSRLADIYVSKKRWEDAQEVYLRILPLTSERVRPYVNLGTIYRKQQKWDVAIEAYQKAILRSNKLEEAFVRLNLGELYEETEQFENAISEYGEVLAILPGSSQAHFHLARVYFETKQFHKSIYHCDRAIALGYHVEPGFLTELEAHR